jgi:ATP-dependent Zn protease
MSYKIPIITSIISFSGIGYYLYNRDKNRLIYHSNDVNFSKIIEYIYKEYPDNINTVSYNDKKMFTFNEWRYRRRITSTKSETMKTITPLLCDINIVYKGENINIKIDALKDFWGDYVKLLESRDCSSEEQFVRTLEMTSNNKEILFDFKDQAMKEMNLIYDKYTKSSNDTMRVFYYKKDYWALLSKSPKRSINTIYLTEGMRDSVVTKIKDFFDDKTRDIYLKYGIPYKCVNLIYGPPGSGKTSIIKGISSELDCDLYVLPISKDMLDTNLVEAFSYINQNDEEDPKSKVIVIEDIDTLFDDRKQGDKDNGITLQGVLNCLDGFMSIEGTMLFLTANKPEVLDYALMRSCRIDQKIELNYADKYQTKCMFNTFFPQLKDEFDDFYDKIKHKEYTTANLQEFLFYNRDCDDIIDKLSIFEDILKKNDPKNYEEIKDENKNFYS